MNPLERAVLDNAITFFTGPDTTSAGHAARLTKLRNSVTALAAYRTSTEKDQGHK